MLITNLKSKSELSNPFQVFEQSYYFLTVIHLVFFLLNFSKYIRNLIKILTIVSNCQNLVRL